MSSRLVKTPIKLLQPDRFRRSANTDFRPIAMLQSRPGTEISNPAPSSGESTNFRFHCWLRITSCVPRRWACATIHRPAMLCLRRGGLFARPERREGAISPVQQGRAVSAARLVHVPRLPQPERSSGCCHHRSPPERSAARGGAVGLLRDVRQSVESCRRHRGARHTPAPPRCAFARLSARAHRTHVAPRIALRGEHHRQRLLGRHTFVSHYIAP